MKMWKSAVLTWVLLSLCHVDALITVIGPLGTVVEWFYDLSVVPPFSTLEGFIEISNPPDGCQKMEAPSFPPSIPYSKIALISDANCRGMTKICSAQAVGYDAVLIFRTQEFFHKSDNLLSDLRLSNTEYKDCPFNITVSLINFDDAVAIKDKYLYDQNLKENFLLKIQLTNYEPWMSKLLLCVAISTVPFAIIGILYKFYKHIRDKCKSRMIARSLHNNLKKLFPALNFTEGDPYENCAICWENFRIGDKLRVLKCSHAYHPKCIDAWLINYQRTCPMCKRAVVLNDSDLNNSSPSESTPLLTSSPATIYSSSISPTNSTVDLSNVTIQSRALGNSETLTELSVPRAIVNGGAGHSSGVDV